MNIEIELCEKSCKKGSYESYHRMQSPLKICAQRRFSDYYQIQRDRFSERQRIY